MRLVAAAGVIVSLAGCSGNRTAAPLSPFIPAPAAPQPSPVNLQVVAIEQAGTGACISDATVEIVRGEGVGRQVVQRGPCSYWDPDYEARFDGLSGTAEVTLRASAAGYLSRERTLNPGLWPSDVTFTLVRE